MAYDWIRKNRRIITLAILAIVFFIVYSWFPYQTTKGGNIKFASPDATANYFWAERIACPAHKECAGQADLTYFEPLNIVANDIVIPRSVRSDDGLVKPVSFLGIILIYGWIAKMIGGWSIIYLTPLFAVLGMLCFYGIIKRVFNAKIAFLSALMLLPLAPYWYYASRSMFHNVLFVDLVLVGVYLSVIARSPSAELRRGATWQSREDNNSDIYTGLPRSPAPRCGAGSLAMTVLGGVFIGLAIITRVSELIWLGPIMLLVWLVYFKQIRWDKVIMFLCGVVLALLPMFYYNQILYGGPLQFGYSQPATQINNEAVIEDIVETEIGNGTSVSDAINKFLPADFNLKMAGRSFIYYYVIMFWYLFWPAFFGGLLFLWRYKKWKKKHWLYFACFVLVSVILGIYYGSWEIHDNPDQTSVTIGNSYTRYWLPIYIMSLPLVALLLVKLSRVFKNKYARQIFQYALVIIFLILNFQTAVFGQEEGLIYIKDSVLADKTAVSKAVPLIEDDAIIISERFDKFFYPEHKVIVGTLVDNKMNKRYAKLVKYGLPLYYYGFIFPEKDIEYLNQRKLAEVGLRIEVVELDEERRLGLYELRIKN